MKLISNIELSGFEYFLALEDSSGAQKWFLYSVIHPDKFFLTGSDRYEDSLNIGDLIKRDCRDYLIESIQISKTTGVVKFYKGKDRLLSIFNAFVDARDYSYPTTQVLLNTDEFTDKRLRKFSAVSGSHSFIFTQHDNIYQSLRFSNGEYNISFRDLPNMKLSRRLEYVEMPRESSHKVQLLSVKKVDYETLKSVVDLDWFFNATTGKFLKLYSHVSSIIDLESKVITPMVREMIRYGLELKDILLIAMDTETTGFNLLNLDEFNPDKDKISTMQLAWKDNQGVLINLDMEYFDNISVEYLIKRLYPLFSADKEKLKYTLLYDEEGRQISETVEIDKSWYHLVGHNTIFDSRVTACYGGQFYFDEDTLQMAFNINPTNIKGSKGLKALTRFFFNHETPELSDLLGKGNEGKFRYLTDIRVAEIYGCADVDYTRLVWKKLRQLMTDRMYASYLALDPYTWYICSGSEYEGIRLKEEFINEGSELIKSDMKSIRELIYAYVGSCMNSMLKLNKSNIFGPSDDEIDELKMQLDDKNRFEFNISGSDIRKVMYDYLKYPVLVRTDKNLPAVNKEAMTKLMFQTNKTPSGFMKRDLVSKGVDKKGNPRVLISCDVFNKYKYPLCYLLSEYKKLDKEYTSFYKPFENSDLEGRLFKGISTTNIETRRISSPVQTIKKDLKQAVIAHSDDYYLCDWDLNQVEARIFVSEAGDETLITKMHDPEKDYHTENASLMFSIPAHLVPKPVRAKAKAVGFGIPYGLSDFKLCERLFTIATDDKMIETRMLRYDFEKANHKCMEKLISYRKSATQPVILQNVLESNSVENYKGPKYERLPSKEMALSLRRFWKVGENDAIGMIFNKNGFYRYFNLTPILGDEKKLASIERAAGNYPIQSFAADLFRILLKRFHIALRKYGISDKVVFHMYIHDELLFSVHKSVDPDLITKICAEACMVRLPKHTSYFIGLNFGDSWYECKQDESELPPLFMLDVKNRIDSDPNYKYREWCDSPKKVYAPQMYKFKLGRIDSVLKSNSNIENGEFDFDKFMEHFDNYTVRSYVYDIDCAYDVDKKDNDALFLSKFLSALKELGYGETTFIKDENSATVNSYIDAMIKATQSKDLDFSELESLDLFEDDASDLIEEEEDFWSFDEDDSGVVNHVLGIRLGIEDEVVSMDIKEPDYKYISKVGTRTIIKVDRFRNVSKVKTYLQQFKSVAGLSVRIETLTGSEVVPGKFEINKDELEKYLEEVNS